jgi:hypothetical protein
VTTPERMEAPHELRGLPAVSMVAGAGFEPATFGGGFKGSAQFLGESSRLVDSTEEWGWLRGSRWNSGNWPGG